MFNRELKEDVERLESRVDYLEKKHSERIPVAECEKCGCLINKETAHCEKEIEEVEEIQYHAPRAWNNGDFFDRGFHYIKTDKVVKKYYCKLHKPKKSVDKK